MTVQACYFFAGGGTGGHLTPGLAVADALCAADPTCRITFIGTGRPVECQLVAAAGYEHIPLPVEPYDVLKRRPWRFLWHNWKAYRQALALVRERRPAAVIGLGGIASAPAIMAATRTRTPSLVLEQNSIMGWANRSFAGKVNAVCVAFWKDPSLRRKARIVLTGNPVRTAIRALASKPVGHSRNLSNTLLVLGGSQGASGLNQGVMRLLARRPDLLAGWKIVHQAGAGERDAIAAEYVRLGFDHVVEALFDDMANRYASATLVISRAGATTLAELACAGCPVILVPYPSAADNHQLSNAQFYDATGAAIVVEQGATPDETAIALERALKPLLGNPKRLLALRHAIRSLARPDAADAVIAVLQSLTATRIN